MEAQSTVTPQSVPEETRSIGVGERLSYGVGQFAEQMVFTPATSFLVFFYTDVAGIAAAAAGAILLFSRILDLFNPVMGFVVDRTKTRCGKARPWLLWLAVPYGISAVLMFTVPDLGPMGKVIYAFLTYNLALTFLFTALDIPYTAMLPLITSDQHQRTLLSLFRMIFSTLGRAGLLCHNHADGKILWWRNAGLATIVHDLRRSRNGAFPCLFCGNERANCSNAAAKSRPICEEGSCSTIEEQVLAVIGGDSLLAIRGDRPLWFQYLLLPVLSAQC